MLEIFYFFISFSLDIVSNNYKYTRISSLLPRFSVVDVTGWESVERVDVRILLVQFEFAATIRR